MDRELPTPAGFLLIDKPKDWTSFDVVAKLRKITGVRKIGHAGTLDPFATGLLIVAVGRAATKQIDQYVKLDKTYVTTFRLGATSSTHDPEGEITPVVSTTVELGSTERLSGSAGEKPAPEGEGLSTSLRSSQDDKGTTARPWPTQEKIESVIKKHFTGDLKQIPPMHAAIKIGGKKLYELARQGKEIDRPPRDITIHAFTVDRYNNDELEATVRVGSGTYIRAIARDLGEHLGVGAYCTQLRRTQIANFHVQDAHQIADITPENWTTLLLDI